jgi:hypothetical protein
MNSGRVRMRQWLYLVAAPIFLFCAMAACDADGETPNCSPEGGECATAPGHSIPSTGTTGMEEAAGDAGALVSLDATGE